MPTGEEGQAPHGRIALYCALSPLHILLAFCYPQADSCLFFLPVCLTVAAKIIYTAMTKPKYFLGHLRGGGNPETAV